MKKLIKTIAAVSATAMLAVPANLTTQAYQVNYGNYMDLKNTCTSNPARGYSWNTLDLQDGLPTFSQKWLNKYKTQKPTFYFKNASTCHMFALLDQTAGKITDLETTKKNVDKISVMDHDTKENFALCLEYKDNSFEGELPEYADFGLRMFNQYWLENDILSKFTINNWDEITANTVSNGFTGKLVLHGYYIAGLKVESSDPYTTFEEPVIVRNRNNISTEVTFHIRNPFPLPFIQFGNANVPGTYSRNVLENVKFTYNCGDSFSTTTNEFKKTLKKNPEYERNNLYQGVISSPNLLTKLEGENRTRFNNNYFRAAKQKNGILFIYIGANDSYISEPKWKNGNGSEKFEAFFRCGGRDELGHCQWIWQQLDNVNQVRFYNNSTKSSEGTQFYQCSSSDLRNRLNKG